MDEKTPSPDTPENVSRREFLTEAAGAAGVATVTYFWFEGFGEPARRADVEPTPPGAPGRTFNGREMATLGAACDRLLPSEGPSSPGARDVNAIGYLDAVLQESFVSKDTVRIIKDGAKKLDERARNMGFPDFAAMPGARQDAAIQVFETWKAPNGRYPGHTWLRKMLQFILEAFFGDPVHGGNPNEVAWKWAGHRPGTPRPSPDQRNWRPKERS